VIRVADAKDVAAVIHVAVDGGLPLAVRSGGHSPAGHSLVEGGLVIDVSGLKTIDLDLENLAVWAGAGLTAGEYTAALAEHGLVTGFGDTASVGISGLTLGGGLGYLSRKHGLSIDSLLAAEVVIADGQVLRVDEDHYPDLFWALRGGGGNFGVATRLRYRLQPLKTVIGGMLFLPATPEVVAGFVTVAGAAPDELSTNAAVMLAPPLPFLPEAFHGQQVLIGSMAWAGNVGAGEKALAPFRALAPALVDTLRLMQYGELFLPEEDFRPLITSRSNFADNIGITEAETILDKLTASEAITSIVQLRVLGGAIGRVSSDATAYAHRQRRVLVNVVAMYVDSEEGDKHRGWVEALSLRLHQGEPGVNLNFLGDEGPDRVREAYPGPTWDRLREVKRKYDPNNLFSRNHNIPPLDP
jgi:FAD/FMN-containing dehydrogenase